MWVIKKFVMVALQSMLLPEANDFCCCFARACACITQGTQRQALVAWQRVSGYRSGRRSRPENRQRKSHKGSLRFFVTEKGRQPRHGVGGLLYGYDRHLRVAQPQRMGCDIGGQLSARRLNRQRHSPPISHRYADSRSFERALCPPMVIPDLPVLPAPHFERKASSHMRGA